MTLGFTLGTEALVGPARWVSNLARNQGWSRSSEDVLVKTIIVLLIFVSILSAAWLAKMWRAADKLHVKIGLPLLALLSSLAALYLWLNPEFFGMQSVNEIRSGSRFVFGSYPTEEKLITLKRQGYTVVSLLHPAVVPFEPVLEREEEELAREVGINLIHLPMLPWVSENRESLDSLRALAASSKGRYYVHCYLGKDRVNVARRAIESVGAINISEEPASKARDIAKMPALERGKITILADSVYLTPYPTDEEFIGFIVAGDIKTVVSVMDPSNPDDTDWIKKERELLQTHKMHFELKPLRLYPYDPEQVLDIVNEIKLLERPVVIHGFLNPSAQTQALIQAWTRNLPPLPPLIFDAELTRGNVAVLAPNIASGPRPESFEFGGFLYQRGVRSFIWLGEQSDIEAKEDMIVAREIGISWQALTDTSQLFSRLVSGGPYYLYGPYLSRMKQEISRRFGPTVPEIKPPSSVEKSPPGFSELQEDLPKKNLKAVFLNFFNRALPDFKTILLFSPLFLFYTSLAGAFAARLKVKKNVKTPYTRKVFHFLIFTMAAVIQLTLGLSGVVLFGVIVTLAVLYSIFRGKGFSFYEALARPTDEPRRSLFVVIPLFSTALGGVLSNLLFLDFAAIGYLVAGWGDALGEPVGTRWGRHRYKVPSLGKVKATRSLEGSFAIFLSGTLVGFLGLVLLGTAPLTAIWVGVACGFAGALVEAFSNHGLDNLTVQLTVSMVAFFLLKLVNR